MTLGQFTHALRCRVCRRLWLRDLRRWISDGAYHFRRGAAGLPFEMRKRNDNEQCGEKP